MDHDGKPRQLVVRSFEEVAAVITAVPLQGIAAGLPLVRMSPQFTIGET